MLQHESLLRIIEDEKILERVAKSRVTDPGWSTRITYWEDNTYEIEYRHSGDDGIHRFMYTPHIDDKHVRYCLIRSKDIAHKFEFPDSYEHIPIQGND